MSIPPKVIHLDFAEIIIYPEYLISTTMEGVVFGKNQLEIFYRLFEEHYPNKKFGLISNRKNDYTVDPTCYLAANKYTNLVGMAIYCHTESTYKNTLFEKTFYNRPFEGFYSLVACEDFIKDLLKK